MKIISLDNHKALKELADENQFYYLAHAYSNVDDRLRDINQETALQVYALLFQHGVFCYEPTCASHYAGIGRKIGTDFEDYRSLNRIMMTRSHGLLVIMSDGWEKSRGVEFEIDYAKRLGIPIIYLEL